MAVSKLSSMAQRWPSTDTSFWMDVPLGHHVEKKAVGNVAADQKTPRPFPGKVIVVFAGVEIGHLEIGPVVPAWTFGPFAGR